MVRPIFFIPCAQCSIDKFTNDIHLLGVTDSLHPEKSADDARKLNEISEDAIEIKAIYPSIVVATEWAKAKDDPAIEFEQNISLVAPDDKEIEIGTPLQVKMDLARHRTFQRTQRIAARMQGEYILKLKWRIVGEDNWEFAAEFPIIFMDFVQNQAHEIK
jgi:hypothetical protein